MSGIALILAGHGSHISANTAGVVWGYVDRLRQLGVADEITACFWKEPPAYSHVLDTVEAGDIVIVPVFTAQGYFTGEVLPTEMGLTGGLTRRNQKRIHLTPTVGEHPLLDAIVETRLRQIVARHGLPPADTAAAIIGHGTQRNRRSRDTARHQADRIRSLNWLREAVAVYLDDEPAIPSVYKSTRAANIIALPYFLADGSHVTRDVPRALGIADKEAGARIKGRSVFYGDPVGTDQTICEVILDLARGTGLPFEAKANHGAWSAFPSAGRIALMQALKTKRILRFGRVTVSRERVWHSDEAKDQRAVASPAELRSLLRENPFRPLPTRGELPGGWHVALEKPADAHAVVETAYPGLIADWAAQNRGSLQTESLAEIGLRQNGLFKGIHQLPRSMIQAAVDRACGACIRQPTWWASSQERRDELPCRSACNFWLSTARQMGDAIA